MMAFALSQWERVIAASNCDSLIYENDFLKVFLKGAIWIALSDALKSFGTGHFCSIKVEKVYKGF